MRMAMRSREVIRVMTKRTTYVLLAVLCAVLGCLCFVIVFSGNRTPSTQQYAPTVTTTSTTTSGVTSMETSDQTPTTTTTATTRPTTPYVSPVDFESLQNINSDIYAWIRIDGTPVNYPVLQSPTDDTLYLDHDSDKQYNRNGAIFSEHQYNSTDFSDPVTVLYGHNMASGEMFGEFQSLYWDRDFLLENDDITIYLPDRELQFQIFAALPYSRMHLLYYYQTEKKSAFDLLINDIYSTRTLSAVLVEERKPEYGDQVLVLSTCLSGDNRYRYLVIGVCKDNS